MIELLLSYGLIMTTIFFLAALGIRYLRDHFAKPIKSVHASLLADMAFNKDANGAELKQLFAQHTGNPDSRGLLLSCSMVANKFLQLLKVVSPSVQVVTEFCYHDAKHCTSTFKFVGRLGNTILIRIGWHPQDFRDNQDRVRFVGNGFNLADWVSGKRGELRFEHTSSIEMVYSSTIEQDNQDIEDVKNLLDKCEVTRQEYITSEVRARLYQLTKRNGNYRIESYYQDVDDYGNDYLDLAYEPVEMEYDGVNYKIPMGKAIPLIGMVVNDQQNVIMFGSPGTGKTRLGEVIQYRLTREYPDTNIIVINAGSFAELQSAETMAQFKQALADHIEDGEKTIIYIDEAETLLKSENNLHTADNSLMLQLMDGSLSRALNCSVILMFNAKPSQLNPALFRAGRTGMVINLTALKAERATRLVEDLKLRLTDKVYNKAKFEKILATENKLLGSDIVYAEVGEATLADVYGCFQSRDTKAAIHNAIREIQGLPPLPIASKPKISTEEVPSNVVTSRRIVNTEEIVALVATKLQPMDGKKKHHNHGKRHHNHPKK